jgi:nitroimidazol reductase NimA-like FMN-containing flavoprotein (pyridoxamine 5'-phosphate oxidase superfamily)
MSPPLSKREREFVLSRDVCRLSTISHNGWPHSVPVSYVYLKGKFLIPSSNSTKKIRNLRKNPKATIVIDNEKNESEVMLECNSRIIAGKTAEDLRRYMRKVKHWQNDQRTLIIELVPIRKASWFKE